MARKGKKREPNIHYYFMRKKGKGGQEGRNFSVSKQQGY